MGSGNSTRTNPLGDADANGVFDLRDATFAAEYLARRVFDPTYGDDFTAEQLAALDIDRNNERNPDDAFYLASVDFRNYRFFSPVHATPVANDTGCHLILEASLYEAGDVPANLDSENTFVFFDLESNSMGFEAFVNATIPVVGSLETRELSI